MIINIVSNKQMVYTGLGKKSVVETFFCNDNCFHVNFSRKYFDDSYTFGLLVKWKCQVSQQKEN